MEPQPTPNTQDAPRAAGRNDRSGDGDRPSWLAGAWRRVRGGG